MEQKLGPAIERDLTWMITGYRSHLEEHIPT